MALLFFIIRVNGRRLAATCFIDGWSRDGWSRGARHRRTCEFQVDEDCVAWEAAANDPTASSVCHVWLSARFVICAASTALDSWPLEVEVL